MILQVKWSKLSFLFVHVLGTFDWGTSKSISNFICLRYLPSGKNIFNHNQALSLNTRTFRSFTSLVEVCPIFFLPHGISHCEAIYSHSVNYIYNYHRLVNNNTFQ